jgi:hypothetical protein
MSEKEASSNQSSPEIIEAEVEFVTESQNTSLVATGRTQPQALARRASEDIQSLDEEWKKYLKFRDKINKVIKNNKKDKDAIVEDVVNAALEIVKDPGYLKFITLGGSLIPAYFKRNKLRKVIESILEKVFDVSLPYAVDYKDLKMTCDNIGGKFYFNSDDHDAIYKAVIQKLMQGPIRNVCLKNEIIDYVNYKLAKINSSYTDFKLNHT